MTDWRVERQARREESQKYLAALSEETREAMRQFVAGMWGSHEAVQMETVGVALLQSIHDRATRPAPPEGARGKALRELYGGTEHGEKGE